MWALRYGTLLTSSFYYNTISMEIRFALIQMLYQILPITQQLCCTVMSKIFVGRSLLEMT